MIITAAATDTALASLSVKIYEKDDYSLPPPFPSHFTGMTSIMYKACLRKGIEAAAIFFDSSHLKVSAFEIYEFHLKVLFYWL